MIYALVRNKKDAKDELSISSLAAVTDKYIQGNEVNHVLLKQLTDGDTLIVKNVLFLGKNVNEIVNKLKIISNYKINLCLAEENLSFKANKLPEISSSLLLAFRIHQSLISLRSKTALQERKSQGKHLGRPFGSNPDLKLDNHKEEIKKLLLSGVSKDKIAEKYNVCRSTVYNFVRKNPEILSEA